MKGARTTSGAHLSAHGKTSPEQYSARRPALPTLQRQVGNQHFGGLLGGTGSFPHRSALEGAFDRPIPGVAVVDSAGCAERGVAAFTAHGTAHFANSNPALKVAAHEATHVLQHAGLSRDAGLGAERHAHTVATRVSRGLPAAGFLGTRGSPVTAAVHNYSEVDVDDQAPNKWDAGDPLRVSDDGNMAVAEKKPRHKLWALADLVTSSQAILTANKSVIELNAVGSSLKGPAPNGGGSRILTQVETRNLKNGTSGDSMEIWADCGKSCRDVVGAGEGTGWNGENMTAGYQEVKRPWYTQIPILGPLLGWIFGGPTKEQKKTAASDPEEMKNEIFNKKLGGSGDEGLKKYQAMSASDREDFDRDAKINRYAMPGTGQGYTMSSGGEPSGPHTWNFHWAGVIMSSGSDRVTLENFSVSNPAVKNARWGFQMYGPPAKPGQTFFEQHKATGQHGDAPTALEVEKRVP